MSAADVDAVLRRIAIDAPFRDLLEQDPRRALAGLDLDADQLRRIEEALLGDDVVGFGQVPVVRGLFGPPPGDAPDDASPAR